MYNMLYPGWRAQCIPLYGGAEDLFVFFFVCLLVFDCVILGRLMLCAGWLAGCIQVDAGAQVCICICIHICIHICIRICICILGRLTYMLHTGWQERCIHLYGAEALFVFFLCVCFIIFFLLLFFVCLCLCLYLIV